MTPEILADATVGLPLIALLVGLPVLGAFAAVAIRDASASLGVARLVAALELVAASSVLAVFEPSLPGFQLVERASWLPALGVEWHVGVDGFSVVFLPLTALVGLAVLLGVRERATRHVGAFAATVLLMQAALVGIYTSLDLILFFGFWEASLAPVLLLAALWGEGAHRRHAASRAMLTLLLGGLPLLLGFMVLAHGPGGWQSDMTVLAAHPPSLPVQITGLALVILGLAFKAPLAPLHGWMPEAVSEGPFGLGMLVVGFKIGAWALLRVGLPLAPDAMVRAAPVLVLIGGCSALYAALLALRQTDWRRLVAWLGVSHVGLVVLGIATLDVAGLQGALFQLASFAVVSTGLILVGGFLHARLQTNDLSAMGGLVGPMPRMAALVLLFVVAGVGLPGTTGFVGEHLILLAAVRTHPGALFLVLPAVAFAGSALAVFVRRAWGGQPVRDGARLSADLLPDELALAGVLAGLVLVGGVAPELVNHLSARTAADLAAHLETVATSMHAPDTVALVGDSMETR